MTIEAMKQALEALEKDSPWREETITSLRQAIEQAERFDKQPTKILSTEKLLNSAGFYKAEKQEPVPWQGCDLDGMVEAFDRVIEAHFFRKNPFHNPIDADAQMALRILRGFIPYMKQYTTPQPQRELNCVCGAVWEGDEMVCVPHKREWVGLTDEEIKHAPHHMVDGAYHYSFKQGAEWAEAKLRSKNQ